MLGRWLAPETVAEFRRTYLGRCPHARPGAAEEAIQLLDWDLFGAVLGSPSALDVLVASGGRLANASAPRSLTALRALMRQGLGVVVRRAELHSAAFAALCRCFAQDLPGEVHVQLYATPAGTHTFGWHYDLEDVFIAQSAGKKDYYFRENTVSQAAPRGRQLDFSRVRQETSPLMMATLIPGDWLYIPARWWHLVHSVENALSISVGVIPRQPSPALTALKGATNRG